MVTKKRYGEAGSLHLVGVHVQGGQRHILIEHVMWSLLMVGGICYYRSCPYYAVVFAAFVRKKKNQWGKPPPPCVVEYSKKKILYSSRK